MRFVLNLQKGISLRNALLLFAMSLLLEPLVHAKDFPGQIIDNKGNVRNVTLSIPVDGPNGEPNFAAMQSKIKYYTEDNKKKKLYPDNASEVRFIFAGKTIRMLSKPATRMMRLGPGKVFLFLEIEGELSLFRVYDRTPGPTSLRQPTSMPGTALVVGFVLTFPSENYFFQLNDEALYRPLRISWRKNMIDYLARCPEVVEKLKKHELGEFTCRELVIFYNEQCTYQQTSPW